MRRLGNEGGFSFLEVVLALGIIMILVAALVPTVSSKLEDAKIARAKDDVQLIAASIASFYNNVGVWPMYKDGTNASTSDSNTFSLLKSKDGVNPAVNSTATGWSLGTDNDTLEDQLVLNKPNDTNKAYPGWKGPYQTVSEDPWGHRYLVNVGHLKDDYGTHGLSHDVVVVLSAGPNGKVETSGNATANSFSIGGDDIACVVR